MSDKYGLIPLDSSFLAGSRWTPAYGLLIVEMIGGQRYASHIDDLTIVNGFRCALSHGRYSTTVIRGQYPCVPCYV